MYVTVESVLKQNQTIWQAVVAITNAYNALKAHIQSIQDYATSHSSTTKGATASKRAARVTMVDAALEVAGAVRAYASANHDEELRAKAAFQPSNFNRLRDTEVSGFCQSIHDAANDVVGSLGDQGVTAATLTAFQAKIDAYNGAVAKPRTARSSNRAAGALMEAEFEETDKLLEDQLDALVVRFKTTQPAFYQAYVAARSIVDDAAGRNGAEETPQPQPQPTS